MKGKPMMSKEAINDLSGRTIEVKVTGGGRVGLIIANCDAVLMDALNANRLCRAIRQAALEAEKEGKVKSE